MTGKDVLLEKDLLGIVATIKRLEYLSLGSQLRIQTIIERNQYRRLDKVNEFHETMAKNDRKPTLKKYNKSDLI